MLIRFWVIQRRCWPLLCKPRWRPFVPAPPVFGASSSWTPSRPSPTSAPSTSGEDCGTSTTSTYSQVLLPSANRLQRQRRNTTDPSLSLKFAHIICHLASRRSQSLEQFADPRRRPYRPDPLLLRPLDPRPRRLPGRRRTRSQRRRTALPLRSIFYSGIYRHFLKIFKITAQI